MPSFSLSLEKIQQANLIRGKTQDTHTHTHHKSTKLKPIISKPKTNKLNNAQTKQYEISPHTQRNLQNYQWVDFVLATAARHVALPLRDFYVLSESSGRRLIFSVQVVVSWIASWLGMNLYTYFFHFRPYINDTIYTILLFLSSSICYDFGVYQESFHIDS